MLCNLQEVAHRQAMALGEAREFIIPKEVNDERKVVDPKAAQPAAPRNFLLVMPALEVSFLS